VRFSQGVRSDRGEVIPADGTVVRLDVSTAPRGRVLAQPGAPVSDAPVAEDGPSEEEQAQIQRMLENYRGEFPHGVEGEQAFRARLTTNVLTTGGSDQDSDIDNRDLTREELNELNEYMGFNLWDCLAMRATEGESGLIPRQEYEAVGLVQIWQRYPELMRWITDQIGVEGLYEVGATSRREVGTKVNALHIWGSGFTLGMGRALAMALGVVTGNGREGDLRDAMQFMRRLHTGLRGPGQPMFGSQHGYVNPILPPEWTQRFLDERRPLSDPEHRDRCQRFSANTELMGFLLHFDNRCGLHDTGPYPTPDGGFMIVRDHFLSEDLYHWNDVTEGLPHAITQAMFFKPDTPLDVAIGDLGTVFTRPADYLRHLTGMTVYARDRWDTPVGDIRLMDDAELDGVQDRCRTASDRLYRRIASMPKRDKIACGAQVYYTEFIVPVARAAGLWDRMRDEFDFFEWDPVTSESYHGLVGGGGAMREFGRLVLTGAFPPVRDPISPEEAYPALHLIAVRGASRELPVDGTELVNAGYVADTPSGYLLTETGRATHGRQLIQERKTYETARLAQAYERFMAQNGPLKELVAKWQALGEHDDAARGELFLEAGEILTRVRVALRRTNEQLLRFEGYLPRLRAAMSRVETGKFEYMADPRVDSVHTVWMQLHEDYLLTQGITREQEGSY